MRFNLKNRPRFDDESPLFQYFAKDIDKWFQCFEAELREKFLTPYADILNVTDVIREILGEESG